MVIVYIVEKYDLSNALNFLNFFLFFWVFVHATNVWPKLVVLKFLHNLSRQLFLNLFLFPSCQLSQQILDL